MTDKNNHTPEIVPELFSRPNLFHHQLPKVLLFRYGIVGVATALFFLFQNQLPFKFPHLLYVCYAALILTGIMHALFRNKNIAGTIFSASPFFDVALSPFVFQFTGGFLSPFVLTSLLTSIGSGITASNRKLSRHMTALCLIGYLSVALLQKYGLLENSVQYSREMMENSSFFFIITGITTVIFCSGLLFVEFLYTILQISVIDLTRSFNAVVRGTTLSPNHDFFANLAECSTTAFNIRCMVIAQLHRTASELETITVWNDGAIKDNYRITIEKTIAREILRNPDQKLFTAKSLENYTGDPVLSFFKVHHLFGLPLLNSHGESIGIMYLLHDKPISNLTFITPLLSIFASRAAAELERKITDQQRAFLEQQLAQSQKMQAIGHMAGGLAHDFNNIISAISGYAGLLKKRVTEDPRNLAFVEHIIEAGKHASMMTAQLAMLVKNDKPKTEPLDVHAIIRNTISMLQAKYESNIKFSSCLTAKPSMTIGENTLLQNVFMNLGINAYDACTAGSGEITFSTSITNLDNSNILCQSFSIEPGRYICIDVSDNGSGMSKEILSRIFEPFFSTKPKDKGTGLGLANVWKYVESYKGAIEVTSIPEVGTTFLIYLPIVEQVQRSTKEAAAAPQEPKKTSDASNKINILIVDDEESVREIYSEILSDDGYEVITCSDGLAALDIVNNGDRFFDLVLLDMVMPRMNGPDTFRELRLKFPTLKILLMSGMSFNEKTAQLLEEPGTLFFQKPCDDEQLLKHIKTILSDTIIPGRVPV